MAAAWGLALRLEGDAAAVAKGGELAAAVDEAAWRLRDGLARASLATGALGAARRGRSGAGEGVEGDYWRAEAEATRQLDTLETLGLAPEPGWAALPVSGLREAVLSRMAATDAAIRQDGGAPGEAAARRDALLDDAVRSRVGAVETAADERRRGLVARALAAASLDRRRLTTAVAAGAALLSALALRGVGARPEPEVEGAGVAAAEDRAEKATEAAGGVAGKATGLRVLLVEDNAMVRFSMEAMLSDLGHEVAVAGDADEAMGLAGGGPDVLVTDLGLPGMDGVTLARQLRTQQPSLRVVVASGRPGSEPGMVWLEKPFDLDGLRRAVEASEALPG